MVKVYTTKPLNIEGIQYTRTNFSEVCTFVERKIRENKISMKAEELSLINATPIQISNREKLGYRFGRLDRFLRIVSGSDTYEIFKDDYVVWSNGDKKILIYPDVTFNEIFTEVKS